MKNYYMYGIYNNEETIDQKIERLLKSGISPADRENSQKFIRLLSESDNCVVTYASNSKILKGYAIYLTYFPND